MLQTENKYTPSIYSTLNFPGKLSFFSRLKLYFIKFIKLFCLKKTLLWFFETMKQKENLYYIQAWLHPQKTHSKLQHCFAKNNSYMYCLLYDVIFLVCLPENFITVPTLVSVFQRKKRLFNSKENKLHNPEIWYNIWFLVGIISTRKGFIFLQFF